MATSYLFFHNFVGDERQMFHQLFKPNLFKSCCTSKAHQRRDQANVHDVKVIVVGIVVVIEQDY